VRTHAAEVLRLHPTCNPSDVATLRNFARRHYREGGDVCVECWTTDDYVAALERCGGDVERTKRAMRKEWRDRTDSLRG
jgi:hypothetical protein